MFVCNKYEQGKTTDKCDLDHDKRHSDGNYENEWTLRLDQLELLTYYYVNHKI